MRGDAQLGEYAGSVDLPPEHEQGTREIASVETRDDAGNEIEWDAAMLARAGFPVAFQLKARMVAPRVLWRHERRTGVRVA